MKRDDERQAAIRQAEAINGDEQVAVDFILGCCFADARLKAAECVNSRPALEQVLSAMRNVDRRVARLTQTRLDAIRHREKTAQAANACISSARRLEQESALTPSQVADLDREWHALEGIVAEQLTEFDSVRREIGERLAAQTALQRVVMDALAELRRVAESLESLAADDLRQTLDRLAASISACAASRELPSLPRNLLPAFEQEYQRLELLQQEHERRRQASAERADALAGWESAPADELDANLLVRQWQSFPPAATADQDRLQARFESLLGSLPRKEKEQETRAEVPAAPDSTAAADHLDALEKALQQGALQQAVEHGEALRALNSGANRIDAAQTERMSQAMSELKRLQNWARWGGRVSREELIRSVEELPSRSIPLDDLANKVSEARKVWKSLDAASGAASRALWEQFDAACNKAYEPVAQRAREQSVERARNAQAAQALITQIDEFAAGAGVGQHESEGNPDWKAVSAFYRRARQSWQQLGPMDRKERKRLDAEFEQAIASLQQPLTRQWQAESARREQLIEQVLALDPAGRGTVDSVRRLQEQWQESARNLPLASSDEQKLWKRFRQACDGLFAQRKKAADAAGAARRENLFAREAFCARLEAAGELPGDDIAQLLKDAAEEWNAFGPVPNDSGAEIQARYQAAIKVLRGQLKAADRQARQTSLVSVMERLALCHEVESALSAGRGGKTDQWIQRWQALPPPEAGTDAVLRSRFDAALAALNDGDRLYAATLDTNRAHLLDELLRLEILAGLDSPPEFAQQRRKIQIEVLQDSLAGNKETAPQARLDDLCRLPALVDDQTMSRIKSLMMRSGT